MNNSFASRSMYINYSMDYKLAGRSVYTTYSMDYKLAGRSVYNQYSIKHIKFIRMYFSESFLRGSYIIVHCSVLKLIQSRCLRRNYCICYITSNIFKNSWSY